MPAPRPTLGMQSISDVVFGLALSIGSVILISKVPQSPTDLGVDVFAFGFNFLIVIIVWTGYRRAMVQVLVGRMLEHVAGEIGREAVR